MRRKKDKSKKKRLFNKSRVLNRKNFTLSRDEILFAGRSADAPPGFSVPEGAVSLKQESGIEKHFFVAVFF